MKLLTYPNYPEGDYFHYCPGCDQLHQINTKRVNEKGAQWSFSGDRSRPTFTPSVNFDWKVCHYNITDGKIIFHGDCTHKLKGQTVELPDIPEYYRTDE